MLSCWLFKCFEVPLMQSFSCERFRQSYNLWPECTPPNGDKEVTTNQEKVNQNVGKKDKKIRNLKT